MVREKDRFDCVIFGAGLFGLHAARVELGRNKRVLLVEQDEAIFTRASSINQARVHLGYHYPRSLTTGLPSVEFFRRFCDEFSFAILHDIRKVYAIAKRNSFVTSRRFEAFCKSIDIPLRAIDLREYFKPDGIASAYETSEVVFDAAAIGHHLFRGVSKHQNFRAVFNATVLSAKTVDGVYTITMSNREVITAGEVINCTYGGINQIREAFHQEPFELKYELTELVLGRVPDQFRRVGITIMDGPFFSLMPWGDGRFHSLTAVQYTPHRTSWDQFSTFPCMDRRPDCTPRAVKNCDSCPQQPASSRDRMIQLSKKYLADDFRFEAVKSNFAIKTVLKRSEVDDSRPTIVERTPREPNFVTVLSGKINTIYEYEKTLYGDPE